MPQLGVEPRAKTPAAAESDLVLDLAAKVLLICPKCERKFNLLFPFDGSAPICRDGVLVGIAPGGG